MSSSQTKSTSEELRQPSKLLNTEFLRSSNVLRMFVIITAIFIAIASFVLAQDSNSSCVVTTQHLSDPPYENYFYSDCNVDAQAVVTSPLSSSNLSIIGPRLIIAWPAGNSGICTFFQPQNGVNGSLAISLINSTIGTPLGPVRRASNTSIPFVGVEGVLSFNNSAELAIAILGSIRNIRDFTEGPSILRPVIQDALTVARTNDNGAIFSRLWLDNITTTTFTLVPYENSTASIDITNKTIGFGAGSYRFSAAFNYPQLTQLTPMQVLNNNSQALIQQESAQTTSLSFLSYSEKLLAGAWRFLTYFGRDSMISALLLEPVLSSGNGSALEAVIGAVLERINRTDGSVCHEETIGDYATFVNLENNITSTAPGFTYPMIDTDYFLPILMARYFNSSPSRIQPLLSRQAGSVDVQNANLTYKDLAYINAQKIMRITAPFQASHTIDSLIHLKDGELVGQWRDSTYGLANGRIPFDVNCALVPAALRAVSTLSSQPGVYPNNSITRRWASTAAIRAQVWEDNTLPLFQYTLSVDNASTLLSQFTTQSTFYNGPTQSSSLSNHSDINSTLINYAIAINSTIDPTPIPILHTDTAFHLFLLNTTNQAQLTTFINSTANTILRPFPAGLTTPVGLVVASPSFSNSSVLIANFTNSAYHGTVVWSWQLALMAKGLERQLARCGLPVNSSSSNSSSSSSSIYVSTSSTSTSPPSSSSTPIPEFCTNPTVYPTVRAAYNTLWDTIEANSAQLQSEVWSWTFDNNTGEYRVEPLGALPPPPGVGGGTESNVRQLWSLTFLAVRRDEGLR